MNSSDIHNTQIYNRFTFLKFRWMNIPPTVEHAEINLQSATASELLFGSRIVEAPWGWRDSLRKLIQLNRIPGEADNAVRMQLHCCYLCYWYLLSCVTNPSKSCWSQPRVIGRSVRLQRSFRTKDNLLNNCVSNMLIRVKRETVLKFESFQIRVLKKKLSIHFYYPNSNKIKSIKIVFSWNTKMNAWKVCFLGKSLEFWWNFRDLYILFIFKLKLCPIDLAYSKICFLRKKSDR